MRPDEAYLLLRMISRHVFGMRLQAALEEIADLAEESPDAFEWEEVDKMFALWFGFGYLFYRSSLSLIRFMVKYEQCQFRRFFG